MQTYPFIRRYVLLRGPSASVMGHACLEARQGRFQVSVQASGLAPESVCRVLLLATGTPSAALDLGLMHASARGCGALRRDAEGNLHDWDALVLAADWPEARLIATAPLDEATHCRAWQLQSALAQYLSVPCEDGVKADDAKRAEPVQEVPPVQEQPPVVRQRVLALPALSWPARLAGLSVYFDALTPCAPFSAPSWRFVQVSLPSGKPAPWCILGVRRWMRRVTATLWAIPEKELCPGVGLSGYRWVQGNGGQGFWVLVEEASPSR